jgi:hypothetical protein
MIADGSELVWNRISARGLREAHVMRYGQPPKADAWMHELVEDYARDTVRRMIDHEKDLNIYHLILWWNAREVVEMAAGCGAPIRYGVLWWINSGETVSWAADLAATVYFRAFARMPEVVWMQRPPPGHETVDVQNMERGDLLGKNAPVRTRTLQVRRGGWVPEERYLVVGIERERFDPVWKPGGFV